MLYVMVHTCILFHQRELDVNKLDEWVYVFRQNSTQMLDETESDVKKLDKVGINPNCINLPFSFCLECCRVTHKT